MAENTPGPSGTVPLKPVNLELCVICQKVDKKVAKLASTDDGRKVIKNTIVIFYRMVWLHALMKT